MEKTSYNLYQSHLEQFWKTIKKKHPKNQILSEIKDCIDCPFPSKRERRDKEYRQAYRKDVLMPLAQYDPYAANILMTEYEWEKFNKPTVFPEYRVIDMMTKAKFEMDSDALIFPFPVFALAMPSGLNLPGVLVTLRPYLDHIESMCTNSIELGEMRESQRSEFIKTRIISDIEQFGKQPSLYMSVITRSPVTGDAHIAQSINDILLDRCLKESLREYDPFRSWKELIKNLMGFDANLTEEEYQIVYSLIQAICGMVIYYRAFPQMMKFGIPNNVKSLDLNNHTIKSPIANHTDSSVDQHIRRAHFRVLKHERYKRASDGGPRIIQVSDCIVGGKLDPYTIKV
mgnify:CR=1 FL=1|tara:strand:- start:330 stop:1358 length:1029 start_codon:yes stop_codon:yes gene_type:complete